MESNYWWIWMIIAAFFIVSEIFTAGFFLLCFGIGAAAAGLIALIGSGMLWQLVVFVIVSFVTFAASRKFANRISKEQPPGIGADRFIGKECVVLVDINNQDNTGRVRLGTEEWRATSDAGDIIAKGTKVVVKSLSGTRLVVGPIAEGE
jgi:membrane protein implicated in regulation of membrane protease activity